MTEHSEDPHHSQSREPSHPQCPYGHFPPSSPPRKNGGWWGFNAMTSCLVAGCVSLLVPVLLLGGFFYITYALFSSGIEEAAAGPFASFVQTSPNPLRERVLRSGKDGAGTIAIVSIHGAIDGNGSPLDGDGSLAHISRQLRAARESKEVKAVILQIDSPGGGLSPSDQLYHEIRLLKKKGKPILAWAGGMMASGGYYLAVAADTIMASPTATIGSIGVMMRHIQLTELMQKTGVKVAPITSGEHKDIASPFREMTAEERGMLQEYVNQSHSRFVDVVAKGRGLAEEKVRTLADGGIFTAATAKEHELVDSIGYIDDAIEWAENAAGETGMRVVGYRRPISFGEFFTEASRGAASAVLETAGRRTSAPKAMAVYDGE